MRRIVIPSDFSDNAMNAIKYGMELFKYERSEIIVMHAYADEVYENTMEMPREFFEEYKQKVKEGTDRKLESIVKEMREISPNPKHDYQYLSVFASLVDAANDLADSEDLDLLIMGTKGQTANRDITFGSMTLQVIKYVKCPVLAVPENYHEVRLENILFPTDYQIPFQRRELKLVRTIAQKFCASLHCLYLTQWDQLSHRQQDNKTFLDDCMGELDCEHLHHEGEDITNAINEAITKYNISMLVMVNTRHSYMERLLYTSTIEKIGLEIKIPFLVLQNLPR